MAKSFETLDVDGQASMFLFIRQQRDLTALVAAELNEWASMEPTGQSSRSALGTLLTLDGMIAAATSGAIGGAAWSIFPAAAKWLKERGAKTPATAEEIVESVRSCLENIEPGIAGSLTVNDLNHEHDGSWHVNLQSGRREFQTAVDQAGDLLSVKVLPAASPPNG